MYKQYICELTARGLQASPATCNIQHCLSVTWWYTWRESVIPGAMTLKNTHYITPIEAMSSLISGMIERSMLCAVSASQSFVRKNKTKQSVCMWVLDAATHIRACTRTNLVRSLTSPHGGGVDRCKDSRSGWCLCWTTRLSLAHPLLCSVLLYWIPPIWRQFFQVAAWGSTDKKHGPKKSFLPLSKISNTVKSHGLLISQHPIR